MLKKLRGYEIVLGILLASAAWAIVLVLTSNTSAQYEICETAKEGARECASYNIFTFALRKVGMSIDVSALITAIATAFIARYTLTLKRSTDKLFDASERQLTHLKTSAEQQLGAYIGVESCEVVSSDWGNNFTVEVQIRNAGQTPAFDVTYCIKAELQVLHGEPLGFTMPDRNPSKVPIAPGFRFPLRAPIAIGGASGTTSMMLVSAQFLCGAESITRMFSTRNNISFFGSEMQTPSENELATV